MRKIIRNKFVHFIILILLISSLFFINSCKRTKDDILFVNYLDLQEEIINEEEEKRMIFERNTELIEKMHSLQNNINSLVSSDIETKNKKIQMEEIPHPQDRISEEQIYLMEDKVVLNIKNANWWHMINSNSMDPLLDEGSSIIAIKPPSENDIKIGDILVFNINTSGYDIVHRVINISEDESGLYFVTKGDNVLSADSSRVRFESVIAVVVGIIY